MIQQVPDDLLYLPLALARRWKRIGSAMMSRTFMRGFIESTGSGTPSASGGAMATLVFPFQGREIDPLEDNLAGVGRISGGDGTGDGGLAGPDSPTRPKVSPRISKLMLLQARTYWRRLGKMESLVTNFRSTSSPATARLHGALVLTLAEPVGFEIDAGIRRTGILDIGDQGKRTSFTSSGNRRDEAAGIG